MNRPKDRGTRYETAVVRYLQALGIDCERRAPSGTLDKGDIANIDGWVLELKDHQAITLAGFMNELAVEQKNAKADFGAVIVKRRGKGVDQSYVCMSLDQFAHLLQNSW